MKKWIMGLALLFAILIPLVVWAVGLIIATGGVPAAGYSCSGDMTDGDMESFEHSDGNFCTSDWTEVDGSAAIDTYDATFAFCESNSLELRLDSDDGGNDCVHVDIGVGETTGWFRFVYQCPDIEASVADYWMVTWRDGACGSGTPNGGILLDGAEKAYVESNQGDTTTEFFDLAPATQYLIEFSFGTNTHEMRVWTWGGAAWASMDTDQANSTLTLVHNDATQFRYMIFTNYQYTHSTAVYAYYDDVEYDSVGWLGSLTCP